MKFKYLFFLILFFFVFFVIIYWIQKNYDVLIKGKFYFTGTISVPLWLAMFIFFLAGFFLMLIIFLIDAWKKTRKIHKLQEEKKEKKVFEEEIEISVYTLLHGEIEETKRILKNLSLEKANTWESKLLDLCLSLRERDIERAEFLIKELEREKKFSLFPLLKGKFFELKEEHEKAIEYLEENLKNIPLSLKVIALKQLRNLYIKINKFKGGLKIQEEIIKLSSTEEDKNLKICLKYEVAKNLKNNKELKGAIQKIQDILKENPKFTPAWVLYGDIYKEDNEEERALSVYTEGFKNTYSSILLHKIEDLYLEKEEATKALEAINHIRFQVEKDTLPRFFLGRLYYRLEMVDEAYKLLSSLQPFAPNSVVLNYLLATLEERFGKKDKALQSLKKSLENYDALKNEYYCFNCQKPLKTWQDRCPFCGAWASIEINFKEEILEDTLGLRITPISYPLY